MFVALMALAPVILVGYSAHYVQRQAIEFWGDAYDPETAQHIFDDWLLQWILPEGGPLMDARFAGCFETAAPLVPVRQSATGKIEALCRFESPPLVSRVRFDDPEVERAIRQLFAEASNVTPR